VALVPAASYGLAAAAANLPLGSGRTVVLAADQFPSNVHVWRVRAAEVGARIVAAAPGPEGDLTAAILASIGPETAVVACAHCRWTDGALVDLVQVAEAARAVGAALVLDLTQSAGALPFDLAAVRPDFLTTACYKWLLGPYSTGFLYVAPHRRDGHPLEEHWLGREGSEDFARLIDYRDAYQPSPALRQGARPRTSRSSDGPRSGALCLAWDWPRIQAPSPHRNRRPSAAAGGASRALGLRRPV
jgi:selenocysteine lyase/cysteine desulfurase